MAEVITSAISEQPQQRIKALLMERLAAVGLRHVEVTAGVDFEGDDVLYVDAFFDLIEPPLDPSRFHFLTTLLREAIEPLGESRFPHLRYHFHEDQKVAGWR